MLNDSALASRHELTPPAAAPVDLRVLIVEPHPCSRRILSDLVCAWGMAVSDCAGMAQALTRLRTAEMRGMRDRVAIVSASVEESGDPLGTLIRCDPQLCNMVLIAVGGAAETDGKRYAGDTTERLADWRFAYDTCIARPVKPASLLDAIRAGCSKRTMPCEMQSTGIRTTKRTAHPSFPLHALVAEDNCVNQIVTKQLLKRLGCTVDIAVNGVEALQLWRSLSYDVIFMDCQMPELDGYDAARAIRANSTIPIIAITANAMPGAREKCYAAGMTGYIAKPFRIEDLAAALHRIAPSGAPPGMSSKGE